MHGPHDILKVDISMTEDVDGLIPEAIQNSNHQQVIYYVLFKLNYIKKKYIYIYI